MYKNRKKEVGDRNEISLTGRIEYTNYFRGKKGGKTKKSMTKITYSEFHHDFDDNEKRIQIKMKGANRQTVVIKSYG